jgi:RNA polymerase sigma-70 factor (ECF subfamily)
MDLQQDDSTDHPNAASEVFATTRWTQVLASRGDSADAQQALSDLCGVYYGSVVAFLRREGRSEDAARELAHEFFARVLQGHSLGAVDPKRGRFRSYLLGALKHFLANRRAHDAREKRGGGIIHESLGSETDTAIGSVIADLSGILPERDFDREWALSVLRRALAALQRECQQNNSTREFEVLKPWLTGENAGRSHADAAGALGMTDGAVRVAIHRLRRRFRSLTKAEIARTVNDPEEIADELRHLIEVLS